MTKHLILCDCSGTQHLDREGIERASGHRCSKVHSALCTDQIGQLAEAMQSEDAIICCTQEWRSFDALSDELGVPTPPLLDLRDRAGWSADRSENLPKMSALIAEAMVPRPAAKAMDVVSEGLCLIAGPAKIALEAAQNLKDMVSVTVLITDQDEVLPSPDFDVIYGRVTRAQGSLGHFTVTLNQFQQPDPTGRGQPRLSAPRDGAQSTCDIILDLTGGTPLFPAHEKRDGYLRPDPSHAPSVASAILQASHLVGTFEKTLFIALDESLCAHRRAEKPACSNCLDVCPTAAITSAGDTVAIDPAICAGCGACSALCPSGAITYDADPFSTHLRRIQALAEGYGAVEGTYKAPELLVHDAHGLEMIALSARYHNGLPAHVIPLEIEAISAFGHAESLAALASGFAHVHILLSPKADRETLLREQELSRALSGDFVTLIDTLDPEAMSDHLFQEHATLKGVQPILPMGARRQVARTAARAISTDETVLPLPENAPYGAVLVDTEACSMCLSCVSLCPSGALGENPDKPQILFQEDACLQCGLCSNICPETAITLEPRMNLANSALEQVVLNEEEPFACIECGSLFGVKSTIDRISEKLTSGVGAFANPEALRLVQMCGDCRVNAQFHSTNNPFAAGERPKTRTTDDYYSDRKDH